MAAALYSDAVVDLAARKPERLVEPSVSAQRNNPLCGDRVTVDLQIADEVVRAVGGQARGCALCCASLAALMDDLPGRPLADLPGRVETVRQALIASAIEPDDPLAPLLDKPVPRPRHRCVLLPWDALTDALSHFSTQA